MAALIGGAIAVVVYGLLCWLCLVYLTIPLTVVGLAGGALAGAGAGVLLVVQVGLGLYPRTVLFTADDVRAGQLPGRVRQGALRRDRAWPQYFVTQVWLDLTTDARICLTQAVLPWRRLYRIVTRLDGERLSWVAAAWPLLLPAAVALSAWTVGVLAALILATAVLAGTAGVAWAAGLAVVGTLRSTDQTWRQVFRAGGACPRCYEVSAVPAYRCAGPHSDTSRHNGDDLHRDLQPGRLGVLWRRCICGRRLPTMVLRASRTMEALCPHCLEPLHPGAGIVTDVRIPVFGAPNAGKTHLVMGALVTMHHLAEAAGIAVSLPDEHSRTSFATYSRYIADGQSPPQTQDRKPVAVTVAVANKRRSVNVHVFDASGVTLMDHAINAQYSYLDTARTLIFVLDPFSLPTVREQYQADHNALFTEANPAVSDPDESYQSTVNRLQMYGVRTDRQRLAFVVSKADLLQKLPIGAMAVGSTGVRTWLADRGMDNLVLAAERDFGEVCFFHVSAKDPGPNGAFAPVNWLMTTERVSFT